MPVKKIEKTGVYRAKDGHALYLQKGATPGEGVTDHYAYDAAATEDYVAFPEGVYFHGVQDAPQDQKAEDTWSGRMVSGAPENKAMKGPADNRTDADLAADADKSKK